MFAAIRPVARPAKPTRPRWLYLLRARAGAQAGAGQSAEAAQRRGVNMSITASPEKTASQLDAAHPHRSITPSRRSHGSRGMHIEQFSAFRRARVQAQPASLLPHTIIPVRLDPSARHKPMRRARNISAIRR